MVTDIEWTNPQNAAAEKAIKQQEETITLIFQKLFQQFIPAHNFSDSDLQISSDELFIKINSHYPSEALSMDLIYKVMLGAGFKFETFPNKIEFVWLLKKKQSDVLS